MPMRALLALALLAASFGLAEPADRKVTLVTLPAKPVELMFRKKRLTLRGVRILTADGKRLALADCSTGLCVEPAKDRVVAVQRPAGALPDAVVVTGGRNVRAAWLAAPTRRYDHAVLGDAIEAGAAVAVDRTNKRHRLTLGLDSVFEDRRVRLADLDGDGDDELVVVRAYATEGAALAVLELGSQGLAIKAETPPIGTPNRWLNPAGIADFDGDGRLEVAIVVTPHLGGLLQLWAYRDGRLSRETELKGFSNHFIGSPVQEMSAIADFDGDGVDDLALPDAARRSIRIISFAKSRIAEPDRIELPGAAVTQILVLKPKGPGRPVLLVGLDTGKLAIIR